MALVPYVLFYDSPITTSANGGGIVAVRPELSAPQVSLECGVFRKHPLGGDALEDPYDLPNVVLGMKAQQYMDVILVITKLFYLQVIPLFNAFHSLTHGGHHFRTQQSLSVLQRKDEVVMGVVRTVIALGDWHTK